MDIKQELGNVAKKATDYSGSGKRKAAKGAIGAVIIVLLGALGLEISNNDFDLGSIFSGNSVKDSKIIRDQKGNLMKTSTGDFLTRVLRDKLGNEVPAGTAGAKYTDEYNCDDFKTQSEAQSFFLKAGGPNKDTSRLDGDNNGIACQSLPKK